MPVQIKMRGELEPYDIDGDFTDVTNALNFQLAQGKTLTILEKPDGGHIALNFPNIIAIDELDESLVGPDA